MPGIAVRPVLAAFAALAIAGVVLVPLIGAASPASAAGMPAPDGRTFWDLGEGYVPTDMNASGTVAGYHADGNGVADGFFVWRNGVTTDLTMPQLAGYSGSRSSYVFINARGDVAASVWWGENDPGSGMHPMDVPYIWSSDNGSYGQPQAVGPVQNYSDEEVFGLNDADDLLLFLNQTEITLADGNHLPRAIQVTGPYGANPTTLADGWDPIGMIGQTKFAYISSSFGYWIAPLADPSAGVTPSFQPIAGSDNGYVLGGANGQTVLQSPGGTITTLPTASSSLGSGFNGVDSSGDVLTRAGYLPFGGPTWEPLGSLFPSGTGLDPDSPSMIGYGVGDGGALFGTDVSPGGSSLDAHGWVLTSHPVPAPVVNSTGDAPARDSGASGCDTGQTVQLNGATVAECTLRAAIQSENAGSVTQKTITVASGIGGTSIAPATPLPALTASDVTIDLSTAPSGFTLAGSADASPGLDISGSGDTVKGAHTVNFPTGILLEGAAGGTVVVGSTLEAHRSGSVGIEVTSKSDRIGGSSAADRDLFPGDFIGVYVHGAAATGTSITGSWFGVAADGTADPTSVGIVVRDASNTTIGGSTTTPGTGAGNVLVAGQTGGTTATDGAITIAGIDALVTGTTVAGNTIGLGSDGATAVAAQSRYGIEVTGRVSGTVIGGAGSGNVIDAEVNGDQPAEVVVNSTAASGTTVTANFIGTDAAGTHALTGFGATRGIYVEGATTTTIGVAGEGNTILGVSDPIVQTVTSSAAQLFYPTTVDVPGTGATQTAATDTTIAGNSIDLLGSSFVPDTNAAFASTIGIVVNGSGDSVAHNIVAGTSTGIAVVEAVGPESVSQNVIGISRDGLSALYDVIDVLVAKSANTTVTQNSVLGLGTGVALVGASSASVSGNTIGVSSSGNGKLKPYTGTLPDDWQPLLAGKSHGIDVDYASTGAAITGNVIGGIDGAAIEIGSQPADDSADHAPVSGVVVSANRIGIGTDGTTPLGSSGPGILLTNALAPVIGANLVGSGDQTTVTPSAGNAIGNNAGAAIQIGSAPGARLLSNLMTGNASGVSGPALIGLAPPLLTAQNAGGQTGVTAELPAGRSGMVQLFSATTGCLALAGDSSGVQPTALLWSGWLESLPASITDFQIDIPALPVGTALVSTITDPTQGTSRFSSCAAVAAGTGGNGPGGSSDGGSSGAGDAGSGSGTVAMSGSVATAHVIQGGSATVIGSGFLADEPVGAELHSTPIDLGTFTADADGTVTITFTVPADLPPGLHHVILTGLTSGRTITIPLTVSARSPLATTGTTDPSGSLLAAALLILLGAGIRLATGRPRRSTMAP